jgi:hypothetical protein
MNIDRRNFLKIIAVGGGLLAAGKLFDVLASDDTKILATKEFENFEITESRKEISVNDKSGSTILIIDKDQF